MIYTIRCCNKDGVWLTYKNPQGATMTLSTPQLFLWSTYVWIAFGSFSIPHVAARDENFLGCKILNTRWSGSLSKRRWSISPKQDDAIGYLCIEYYSGKFRCSLVYYISGRYGGLQWFQLKPPLKERVPLISDDWYREEQKSPWSMVGYCVSLGAVLKGKLVVASKNDSKSWWWPLLLLLFNVVHLS